MDLGQAPTFFVTQKGVYDTDSLINNGSSVYADLLEHLPQEAIEDTNQAARCLAFTLPTASGFHMARATEAVLAPPISLDSRLAKTAGPERKGRDGPEAEGEQGDRRS